MNATTQTLQAHTGRASTFKWIASASMMEAVVAIAIIALAIVGLAGDYPLTMAAIATIVTGAAILLEGGAFAHARARQEFNSGLSAEFLGAVGGVILGILALMGVTTITLLSVAVLVYGITFLLAGAMNSQAVTTSMDGHLLVGLSVSVLGLLAVIGIVPTTLVLVGLLILGAMSLFGGSIKGLRLMADTPALR